MLSALIEASIRLGQLLNPCSDLTEAGIETYINAAQLLKAPLLIVSTDPGILTSVKPLQLLNAPAPMVLSEAGRLMSVNPPQPANA